MELIQAGPLRVRCVGRGDGPAVVLCHGYGAPGDDLCGLAHAIDAGPRARWFFPEAPHPLPSEYGPGGRQWWPIDMVALQRAIMRGEGRVLDPEAEPEGMADARAALVECLAWLREHREAEPSRTVIGGFSQGSMLTTDLALSSGDPWAGLLVFSGTLLARPRWEAALRARSTALQVFQSHGKVDPILPYPSGEALRSTFTAGGAKVEWVPFNGQHGIPDLVMARAGSWLRDRFE